MRAQLAILTLALLLLGACGQEEETAVEEAPSERATAEETTERTTDEIMEESTKQQIEQASQQELPINLEPAQQIPQEASDVTPSDCIPPCQEAAVEGGEAPAAEVLPVEVPPVEVPVQPWDNDPSVTGVPCAIWTCRDERGRSNAEIQGEWMNATPEEKAAIREQNIAKRN